jgi:NAD(P)-dependent dehydrogenase (short-subunit alcohol dehydrogenase family)
VGHLEAGAGAAGLVKAILVLLHREAPPNLHLKKLNPHINVEGFPVLFPQERTPLGRWTGSGGRILAGLSSFGFGGTNAHVILEEAERVEGEEALLAPLEPIYKRQPFPWRKVASKRADPTMYEVDWEAQPISAGFAAARVLVLGGDAALAAALKGVVKGDMHVTVVSHKGRLTTLGSAEAGLRSADLTNEGQLGELLDSEPGAVVLLLAPALSLASGLAVVRSAVARSSASRPSQVIFVSSGCHGIGNTMVSEPGARQGWLSGFVKTIGIEHGELHARVVDVEPGAEALTNRVCQLVSGAVGLPAGEVELVLRENSLYVPRLVGSQVEVTKEVKAPVRADATYLITGGFGALGLVFAARLIEEGARNVVLLSRSGANSDSAQAELKALQATGARVEAIKCDVSDGQSVLAMLSSVSKSMPPVRGVLHSAGVLDDATIENQSLERFERVFSPKVRVAL